MLDMLTDRCATMCLLVNLALLYPRATLLFQLSMSLDVASHWLHLHRSAALGCWPAEGRGEPAGRVSGMASGFWEVSFSACFEQPRAGPLWVNFSFVYSWIKQSLKRF